MVAVISLLSVLAISFFIVRVGTVALMMTGLSEDVASFQSLSAFSGVGFTTHEAESVVANQTRRSITAMLIRLGSAGVVTVISSSILSFTGSQTQATEHFLIIVLGLAVLVYLSRSHWFQSLITPIIRRTLRQAGLMDLQDYASVLHVSEGYAVAEMEVAPDSWLARSTLAELRLKAEGVSVLGVLRHNQEYIGAPPPTHQFLPGDRLIAYGRNARLVELSTRKRDDHEAKKEAEAEHDRVAEVEPKEPQ